MTYSVAILSAADAALQAHLLQHFRRGTRQEDLCFGLWRPSSGAERQTALVFEAVLPLEGDRLLSGNVSFTPQYFERALALAIQKGAGLCLLHSHPTPGWQSMSEDDIKAERGRAASTKAGTMLPLVGLTLGTDGTWSARFWLKKGPQHYERQWCKSARIVGQALTVHFAPSAKPYQSQETQLRTVSAWGEGKQRIFSQMTVGVVGAGSVGCLVAEALARMGVGNIKLIDFDTIEVINLDRLLHADSRYAKGDTAKVELTAKRLTRSATAADFSVEPLEFSVCEREGYLAALDCDVIFSCVDRPWGRCVVNHLAYGHLIPVIDGGIAAEQRADGSNLVRADWKAHVAAPTRQCLECLGQYDSGLVALERDGYLDDPSYIKSLPGSHQLRRNENVFAFSMHLAGMELAHFLSLTLAPYGIADIGTQMYHLVTGSMDDGLRGICHPNCAFQANIAIGDQAPFEVTGVHTFAEKQRAKRKARKRSWKGKVVRWLRDLV
jgi:molybdopterin-synthase adenylyltransferase